MLAIRLQRVGRKGLPQYRVIVQEADRTPTSGKVVAHLGSYNPHTKEVKVDTEKASFYLNNGAQPSERVAKILKNEGVSLPKWVAFSEPKERKTRNPEKLRKNQAAEEKPAEEPQEEASEAAATEETSAEDAPADATQEEVVEEASETPAEDTKAE